MFLIGCSKEAAEPNPVNPIEYVESFGWHIEEKTSESRVETTSADPSLAAIVDLKPYADKEMYMTTYLLKEKQKTGKKLYANIYQVHEEIIGGYVNAEEWEPGVFSLKDTERLKKEGTIIE